MGFGHRFGDVHLALRVAAPGSGHAGTSFRRVRRLYRRVAARGRALHRCARAAMALVSRPHARRPNEPLGQDLPAVGTGRLPPEERGWPGRRLALHVRGSEALLRQARSARGHLRDELRGRAEPAERAGWHLPSAAQATLLRARHPGSLGAAENPVRPFPALDSDSAPQRPRAVPLLRPVRPRVLNALELLVDLGATASGDGHWTHDARHWRHGA